MAGQNVHQEKYRADSLLKTGDTSNAIGCFLKLYEIEDVYDFHELWRWGMVCAKVGKPEWALNICQNAVENGILNARNSGRSYRLLQKDVLKYLGEDTWSKFVSLNQYKLQRYRRFSLVRELDSILTQDQKLRKKRKKWKRRFGVSHTAYGLKWSLFNTEIERHERHDTLMYLYDEFMRDDSLNLQKFIDLVVFENRIPTDKELLGLTTAGILFLHSAKFDFGLTYAEIVKEELDFKRLTPYTYGWWYGLKSDYQRLPRLYYFSSSRKSIDLLSDHEIIQINKDRVSVGLPRLPATVWRYYDVW